MSRALVLLAAGMSTRYGRLKQLEPVGPGGEALLDYAVFDAVRAGFSKVVLIIRRELEDAFERHIRGRWPVSLEVTFHHQSIWDLPGLAPGLADSPALGKILATRSKPWGTAHALLTARSHLDGPFVLLNADDFYGAPAFRQAVGFLAESGASTDPTFGLVTYTLADTLSEHGGVSRGICLVDREGWLEGIREVLEIARVGEGLRGREVSGEELELRGGEPISTNFWIFDPAVFPLLEAGFCEFVEGQLDHSGAQPEFLIPTVVNEALRTGAARVRGIPTRSPFLGITHPEDRGWVVEGLEEMTSRGEYPRPLWG